MKNILKISFTIAAGILLVCCNKSEIEYDKGSTPLQLSASKDDVVLNVHNPNGDALELTWTRGSNNGTNAAIDYLLEMDVAENNFAGDGYYTNEDGLTNSTRCVYTNSSLNSILLDELSLTPGQSVRMVARVTAFVRDDTVEDQIATFQFTATPYQPVSATLFMIGEATPGGWSLDAATEMTPIQGLAGTFTWTGKLKAGEYKFVVSKDDWLPSYNLDPDSEDGFDLIYRTADNGVADTPFVMATEAFYRVTVSLVDLTLILSEIAGPDFDAIYLEGDFAGGSRIQLTQNPGNLFQFSYDGMFTWNGSGKIWFSTEPAGSLRPLSDGASISTTAFTTTGGDNTWVMTESQANNRYKIVVDITVGGESVTFTPFTPFTELYMVGNATAAGWSIADAVPMTVTGNTYSWEGTLTAGEMKITCDKNESWSGAWIMPPTGGLVPPGDTTPLQAILYDMPNDPSAAGVDNKWVFETAGTYRITGNQLTETIVIELVQ